MTILLDECIDRRLAKDIPGHAVKTVPKMGWAIIENAVIVLHARSNRREDLRSS